MPTFLYAHFVSFDIQRIQDRNTRKSNPVFIQCLNFAFISLFFR